MIKGIKTLVRDLLSSAGYGSYEKALRRYTCVECFIYSAIVDHEMDKISIVDRSKNEDNRVNVSFDTFRTMDRSRIVLSSTGEVFGYDPQIGLVGAKGSMIPIRLDDDEVYAVSKSYIIVYKMGSQLVRFYAKDHQNRRPIVMEPVHIQATIDVLSYLMEQVNHMEYDEDKSTLSFLHVFRARPSTDPVFPLRKCLTNRIVVVNYDSQRNYQNPKMKEITIN